MSGANRDANAPGPNVCVVGTGVLGLLATKNLREQGLNVTTFTKDEFTGGLWHVSDDKEKLTALEQTSANTSKQTVSLIWALDKRCFCTRSLYTKLMWLIEELHLRFPDARR